MKTPKFWYEPPSWKASIFLPLGLLYNLFSSLRWLDPGFSYPVSHRVFSAIKAAEPPDAAWPLTQELAQSMSVLMALDGQKWMGVCLLLCLIRCFFWWRENSSAPVLLSFDRIS